MHRFRFSSPLLLSAALLLGAAPLVPAPAQAGGIVLTPELHTRVFELRNVKPSLVAYWFDPAHQSMPLDILWGRTASLNLSIQIGAEMGPDGVVKPRPRLPGNANGPVGLVLPTGIQKISAIDPQGALFAVGTQEGLDALGTLLPTLDVALVQYEIEARFYRVGLTDLPALGLQFDTLRGESADTFGSATALPPDFEARLARLFSPKAPVALTAPRVTVIDGLDGESKRPSFTALGLNETPALAPPRFALVTTAIGIRAGVTRLQNGLIEVAIEPHFGSRTVSITANVADEQPFAIRMSPATDARQLLVVVNTRRVRRAMDDK